MGRKGEEMNGWKEMQRSLVVAVQKKKKPINDIQKLTVTNISKNRNERI